MTATTYTTDQIKTEVKNLVARVTEREPDEIPDDAHFMDQLGVDSLMAMEIMIAVDRKFGIDIPDQMLTRRLFSSVDSLACPPRRRPMGAVRRGEGAVVAERPPCRASSGTDRRAGVEVHRWVV